MTSLKRLLLNLPLCWCTCPIRKQCLLCEKGVEGLTHPNSFVNDRGKTCALLSLEIFNFDESACTIEIKKHRKRCCGLEGDTTITQQPPPDITLAKDGPYQPCNLCRNNATPSNPVMVINMLYIGVATCADYFKLGLKGWILPSLCPALQFFAFEPCGCNTLFS